jgi:NADPH-dependent 2,4-dienoyl-CoA reductase/sulfur reductase-like enzyme
MTAANNNKQGERIVIVGAGQAGARAAEALRAAGHAGSIALIGEEPHEPYERPQLSKETLLKPGAPVVKVKDEAAWRALEVDLHTGCRVVACDAEKRSVELADGRLFRFDRLLLSTGVTPRRLRALENGSVPVLYLRTIEEALALRSALRPDARVVIVGGGVIGLETAAAAVVAQCSVTVIETAPTLLARALPKVASDFLLRRHKAAGVDFRFGAQATAVEGDELVLSDGSRLRADIIVVGIGAVPNVALAEHLKVEAAEGFRVDDCGRAEAPQIFAAGDVALQRDDESGRWRRVETWANAQNQAIAVAKTMAGVATPYREPIWFWSDQYDFNLQVVGDMAGGDVICRGDPASDRFTLLCCDGNVVRGGVTINRRPDMAALRRLVAERKAVELATLENPTIDLRKVA